MPFLKTSVAGRGFSEDHSGDVGKAFVLNETAVWKKGLRDPVGKRFSLYGRPGVIAGVVKETHFQSFRQEAGPRPITATSI